MTENAEGQPIAFAGAAMSYFEHTTGDFARLTDEEWQDSKQKDSKSTRPAFVDLYLANQKGGPRSIGEMQSLLTSVEESSIPVSDLRLSIYPNPVESSTAISFSVPFELSQNNVTVRVISLDGGFVKTLSNRMLPEGNYMLQWNPQESRVAPGAYFVELQIGDKRITRKIMLTGK